MTGVVIPDPRGGLVWIHGKDGSGNPVKVLVDADGHPQVDTLTSALPAGAATETKQDTLIAALSALEADVTITFIIDGAGSAIITGEKGHLEIPFAYTIERVTMLADQSGSIVVDIWKDNYANFPPTNDDSITASAPPTITTALKSQDSTLTGWTTDVVAGDILAYNVDSCTDIERVTISLKVTKS